MNTPKRIKIYLAHALTKAPQEFRTAVEGLKADLVMRRPEWQFLDFFGLGALPPEEDWRISRADFGNVVECHLLVDFVDVDSTGMGREAGMRIALGLPILSVAHRDWKKTRMVTGPAQDWPHCCMFERYGNIGEVESLIEKAIAHFEINPDSAPLPLVPAPHIVELYQERIDSGETPQRAFRRLMESGHGPDFVTVPVTPDTLFREPAARLSNR